MGTFFKAFWGRMGRNTGNRVSNAIFGDKWSTPYRVGVNNADKKSKKSSGRKRRDYDDDEDYTPRGSRRTTTTVVEVKDDRAYYRARSEESARKAKAEAEEKAYRRKRESSRITDIKGALSKINRMAIPRNEDALVDMLQELSINFSSVASLTHDDPETGKETVNLLRKAIYSKYSQALQVLESRYPSCPYCWDFFLGKWRMFFGRKPWSWIWVVYVLIVFAGTYCVITAPQPGDRELVGMFYALPVLLALFILITRFLRMR